MHKKYFTVILLGCCALLLTALNGFSQGYAIKVKMNNYNRDQLFLAYRLGTKTYIADTTTKNAEGFFVFKGPEAKHPGLYMIVTEPDNNYFEFLLPGKNEQKFTLNATAGKTIEWSVNGSPENEQFRQYLQFLNDKRTQLNALQEKQTADDTGNKNKSAGEDDINRAVDAYRNAIIRNNPGTFLTNIVKAGIEPNIPEEVKQQPKDAALNYYRSHFFDNIALYDNRLLYSSIIIDKVEYYIEKLTVQNPDAVITAVDAVMNKVKSAGDEEVYKFVLIHLINKYATSKMVCMDKVYVHIASTYYCGNSTPSWIAKEQLEKICKQVEAKRHSQCGNVAPSINLVDAGSSTTINLFAINAPYTAIIFYTPDARASDKELEALKLVYQTWKSNGLAIIGVVNATKEKTKATVTSQAIPWPSGSATGDELELLENKYDITAYPTIYLLDKDKKIMYKKISATQLDEILGSLLK